MKTGRKNGHSKVAVKGIPALDRGEERGAQEFRWGLVLLV
jgi:hypothetical protein